MARHKFDGVWRCFIMPKVFGSEPPDDHVELDIKKATNSNGAIDSDSKLASTNITGKITGKRLEFEHPSGAGFKKNYRGRHFLDIPNASGETRLVMVGLFRKEEVVVAGKKKARSKAATNGQEDGIWIAVKP